MLRSEMTMPESLTLLCSHVQDLLALNGQGDFYRSRSSLPSRYVSLDFRPNFYLDVALPKERPREPLIFSQQPQ